MIWLIFHLCHDIDENISHCIYQHSAREAELCMSVYIEGEQSLPPQHMPLWGTDYYKLIIFKARKAQDETLTVPQTV